MKTARRYYQATSKTGVVDTFSSATREYTFAVVLEFKAVKERKRVEVPSERFARCPVTNEMILVPHMCYRNEVSYHDHANGNGEKVYSFHTTKALAERALSARLGSDTFAGYIVPTVRIK
jgi:hypothetical protein